MKIMLRLSLATCYVLLAACVSHSEYPPSWPVLMKEGGTECPNVSGRYENKPTTARYGQENDPISSEVLYDDITNEGYWGSHLCNDCVVELQWLDEKHDALRVTLTYPSPSPSLVPGSEADSVSTPHHNEQETFHRSRGELSCTDGALSVAYTDGATNIFNSTFEWGHRTYWVAHDGSLVRMQKMKALGYVLTFIPFYISTDTYVRWLKVQ